MNRENDLTRHVEDVISDGIFPINELIGALIALRDSGVERIEMSAGYNNIECLIDLRK